MMLDVSCKHDDQPNRLPTGGVIARKFTIYIILISLIIGVLGILLRTYTGYLAYLEDIQLNRKTLRQTTIPALINSVWVADEAQVNIILNGIKSAPGIAYVEVRSDKKTYHAGQNTVSSSIKQHYNLSRKFKGQIIHLGRLTVVYDLGYVYSRLKSGLFTEFWLQLITVMILAVVIVLTFQRLIGRPLAHIANYARDIDPRTGDETSVSESLQKTGSPFQGELKNLATALDAMNNNLRLAYAEQTNLINALEQKNSELEQFTYTVSHDLKSPLVTIKGFSTLIKDSIESDDQSKIDSDLTYIADAVDKMQLLLDDLLELSRIGRQHTEVSSINMTELVEEVLEQLKGRVEERSVNIEIEQDMPNVYGERSRIAEIYQNLIENAIKYSRDEGQSHIIVGVNQNSSPPEFFVKDNGIGIDPRYQQKIFGLFERLHADTEGTGIGLAIVKRVVEHHQGMIYVESQGKGQGSTFYFTLPGIQKEDGNE